MKKRALKAVIKLRTRLGVYVIALARYLDGIGLCLMPEPYREAYILGRTVGRAEAWRRIQEDARIHVYEEAELPDGWARASASAAEEDEARDAH